jgi:hypothetical protein
MPRRLMINQQKNDLKNAYYFLGVTAAVPLVGGMILTWDTGI